VAYRNKQGMQAKFPAILAIIPIRNYGEGWGVFTVQAVKINKMGEGLKTDVQAVIGKICIKFLLQAAEIALR